MKKLILCFVLALPVAVQVLPAAAQSVAAESFVRGVFTNGESLFIITSDGRIQIELETGQSAYFIRFRGREYAVKYWIEGNKGYARINGKTFEVRRVQKSSVSKYAWT